jgi:aryl-alcohol dehydrogenase-like predicted oxidoreductase
VLGRTGLVVSRIGLGLAALGRPGYVNLGHAEDLGRDYDEVSMEGRAYRVLDAAWAASVRYFDAARSYGLAERFLSAWLADRGITPADVTIGSKWGYTYTAGWQVTALRHEVKEHSVAALQRQRRESAELLGPFLKVYQVHSATTESGVLENGAVLDELARLAAGGLHVGLTLSGAEQVETLRRALEIRRDGVLLFETVQATWNLLEPSAGSALVEAREAGLGVIVKEVLANGRLTDRNQSPAFSEKRVLLQREAARLGATVDAVALAACLAQPFTDVVLSGAATVSQLDANLKSQSVRLDEEALARLGRLAELPAEYWATRRALPWN